MDILFIYFHDFESFLISFLATICVLLTHQYKSVYNRFVIEYIHITYSIL